MNSNSRRLTTKPTNTKQAIPKVVVPPPVNLPSRRREQSNVLPRPPSANGVSSSSDSLNLRSRWAGSSAPLPEPARPIGFLRREDFPSLKDGHAREEKQETEKIRVPEEPFIPDRFRTKNPFAPNSQTHNGNQQSYETQKQNFEIRRDRFDQSVNRIGVLPPPLVRLSRSCSNWVDDDRDTGQCPGGVGGRRDEGQFQSGFRRQGQSFASSALADATTDLDFGDSFYGRTFIPRKRKENDSNSVMLPDPERESYEAELERVQRMQEEERRRLAEAQERELEFAKRQQEEREHILREEEERKRKILEEEARERARKAEEEELEMRKKMQERREREEEKRRILLEEERRKEAARQKLLEIERRIAQRQEVEETTNVTLSLQTEKAGDDEGSGAYNKDMLGKEYNTNACEDSNQNKSISTVQCSTESGSDEEDAALSSSSCSNAGFPDTILTGEGNMIAADDHLLERRPFEQDSHPSLGVNSSSFPKGMGDLSRGNVEPLLQESDYAFEAANYLPLHLEEELSTSREEQVEQESAGKVEHEHVRQRNDACFHASNYHPNQNESDPSFASNGVENHFVKSVFENENATSSSARFSSTYTDPASLQDGISEGLSVKNGADLQIHISDFQSIQNLPRFPENGVAQDTYIDAVSHSLPMNVNGCSEDSEDNMKADMRSVADDYFRSSEMTLKDIVFPAEEDIVERVYNIDGQDAKVNTAVKDVICNGKARDSDLNQTGSPNFISSYPSSSQCSIAESESIDASGINLKSCNEQLINTIGSNWSQNLTELSQQFDHGDAWVLEKRDLMNGRQCPEERENKKTCVEQKWSSETEQERVHKENETGIFDAPFISKSNSIAKEEVGAASLNFGENNGNSDLNILKNVIKPHEVLVHKISYDGSPFPQIPTLVEDKEENLLSSNTPDSILCDTQQLSSHVTVNPGYELCVTSQPLTSSQSLQVNISEPSVDKLITPFQLKFGYFPPFLMFPSSITAILFGSIPAPLDLSPDTQQQSNDLNGYVPCSLHLPSTTSLSAAQEYFRFGQSSSSSKKDNSQVIASRRVSKVENKNKDEASMDRLNEAGNISAHHSAMTTSDLLAESSVKVSHTEAFKSFSTLHVQNGASKVNMTVPGKRFERSKSGSNRQQRERKIMYVPKSRRDLATAHTSMPSQLQQDYRIHNQKMYNKNQRFYSHQQKSYARFDRGVDALKNMEDSSAMSLNQDQIQTLEKTDSQKSLSSKGLQINRNVSELAMDPPLQSGVVHVFQQLGIHAGSDEEGFIQVRSRRQMQNEKRQKKQKAQDIDSPKNRNNKRISEGKKDVSNNYSEVVRGFLKLQPMRNKVKTQEKLVWKQRGSNSATEAANLNRNVSNTGGNVQLS